MFCLPEILILLKIYSLLSYDALLACIVFSDVLTNMLGKGKDVLFAGDSDHLELPILCLRMFCLQRL
jgi:hypothetical protein